MPWDVCQYIICFLTASSQGYQGYLPGRLYDLDTSKYGNHDELKKLIKAFQNKRVKCISDIVINHRTAEKADSSGLMTIFEGGTPDDLLDWDRSFICINDKPIYGTGNPDTGDTFGDAPVGEIWYSGRSLEKQDAYQRQTVKWIEDTGGEVTAFDFPTKRILQTALLQGKLWRLKDSNGGAPGVIGLKPGNAVTFIDNHATGSTQSQWPFKDDKVMQGYVYILAHPGIPSVATAIDEKIIAKIGPREDKVAQLIPSNFQPALSGEHYAVWEKKA
ncbi:hypothetical protein FH972_005109 [Carpinus fangiana]|uniref:alpha-amylase n=1 Tax=Carpinus fangiana TaxID=176857 RepID=A0A5N6QNL9_9ROSI|nr:hypothetical protein FH972_005109 [Carpinus fangiana]